MVNEIKTKFSLRLHGFAVKYFLFASLFAWVVITSCEKNIVLDVPEPEIQMVVEGYIQNGEHPYVYLSYNSGFFDVIDSSQLLNYAVKNAIVTVFDGTTTDTLKEVFSGYGYFYQAQNMTGTPGKFYSLRVEADGKVATALTKIPDIVKLDSVWWKVDGNRDSLGFAWAHLTDPDTMGNCYRWFAKRLGKDDDFIPPFGSVFEDKFINGKSFDFGYNRGKARGSLAEDDSNDERGYFKRGDSIVVKFCSIDFEHFQFWRTFSQQVNSNGNPFAAPAPIKSNVTGALGVWGGYAAAFDTIIAQ